jgi:uncharacterized protein involved in type VI secretion and phage assembly
MGRKIGAAGLTQHNDKFYGNYRGTVMDNVDPDKLGRIKVKIYPMLSGVETENLPWAVPAMPLSSGAGENYGSFYVPEVGTNVWVFLEAGDIYQPVYFAEATDGLKGLPVGIDEDYPSTTVTETKTGIVIKINRKEGNENVLVEHPKGSFIEMDKDGAITINTSETAGHITIEADEADIDVIADKGDVNISANEGDINIEAAQSNINVSTGGDADVNAAGNVTIKGLTVQIN